MPIKNDADTLSTGFVLRGAGSEFQRSNAIRAPLEREQALIEIDALVALSFNLTEEELVQIYQVLFPVLLMYDRERGFNRRERLVHAHRRFSERGW